MYLDEILNAILNSDIHRRTFRKHFYTVPKEHLEKIFNYMIIESPHHAELIQVLKKEQND